MRPLSASQRAQLEAATLAFEQAMPGSPAEQYVAGRGFDPHTVADFRLGYVGEALPGYERFVGRLAIPNMCAAGHVVGMKFRSLDGAEPKYDKPAGMSNRLFNLRALNNPSSILVVTEGELDTLAVTMLGFPCIGVQGVKSWKPHHKCLLEGYERVVVVRDMDDYGLELAKQIAEQDLPVSIVEPPGGDDANDSVINGFRNQLSEVISRGGGLK